MNIKKALFLILIFISTTISAQELEVKRMEALTMDTYASVHKRLDKNDVPCAVVRVSLPADGATFSGTNSIGSIERIGADYIVFMPASSKKMYIQHPHFHELEVVFNDYGFKTLQSLATYRITINALQANATQKKQTLNIKVTPSDAIVQIDGETVEESSISIAVGTHKYNVAAKGYHSQDGAIEVKESSPAKLVVELDRKASQAVAQRQTIAPAASSETLPGASTATQTANGVIARGKVTYSENGEPCVGAVITIPGTDRSTISDMEGYFTVSVPAGKNIQVSHVGRATQTLNPSSNMAIKLRQVHEYVDLGLSVKWATCNVGATKPEEYGEYYAWGETKTKSSYSWEKYFDTPDGANTFRKYKFRKGVKTNLAPQDDVAHIKWGAKWRMPTKQEMDELCTRCTWSADVQNGVKGVRITGPNGNSIFLPNSGSRNSGYGEGKELQGVGNCGYYWSSTLVTTGSVHVAYYAYGMSFISSSKRGDFNNDVRCNGYTVRPVCP